MFDTVHLAMRQAVRMFGHVGDPIFNASGFAQAMASIAGVESLLDGRMVAAILCGRNDVQILSGGCHYRLIEGDQP